MKTTIKPTAKRGRGRPRKYPLPSNGSVKTPVAKPRKPYGPRKSKNVGLSDENYRDYIAATIVSNDPEKSGVFVPNNKEICRGLLNGEPGAVVEVLIVRRLIGSEIGSDIANLPIVENLPVAQDPYANEEGSELPKPPSKAQTARGVTFTSFLTKDSEVREWLAAN